MQQPAVAGEGATAPALRDDDLVGDKAGLLRGMAGAGPLSAADLAERAGVRQRYTEEWLAAMASRPGKLPYKPPR